jgi:hypothetical protein
MATITELNSGDDGATSRGVINTNFDNLNTDKLESSDLPSASTSAEGMVELATDAEALAGSSDSVVLTPGNLGYTGFLTGWIPANETWTYSSTDDPTGVITVPSDATTKYSVGMRIKFTNGGNTIYGIITAVTSTTITFLHEIDPSDSQALHLMANSAITSPSYSTQNAFGFPIEKNKWRIKVELVSNYVKSSPSSGVWYNVNALNTITAPIGAWYKSFETYFQAPAGSTSQYSETYATLSTANNSEIDSEMTDVFRFELDDTTTSYHRAVHKVCDKFEVFSSKTPLYLNHKTVSAGTPGDITILNSVRKGIIQLDCAYL